MADAKWPADIEAFMNACYAGDIAQVSMLVRRGIDLNAPLPNGDGVLVSVAGMGDARLEIIKLLVEHGADVNASSGGKSLLAELQGPTYCDNEQTIAFLKSKGAR